MGCAGPGAGAERGGWVGSAALQRAESLRAGNEVGPAVAAEPACSLGHTSSTGLRCPHPCRGPLCTPASWPGWTHAPPSAQTLGEPVAPRPARRGGQAGSGRPLPGQGDGGCRREGPGGHGGQDGWPKPFQARLASLGSLAVPGDVTRAGALSEGSGPVPPDRPWGPLLIPAHHPQTGPRGGPRPGPEPGAGGARGCLSPPGRPRLLTCSVEPARSRLGSCRPQSANIASPSAARCQVPPPAWLEGVAQAARPGTGLRAASLGAGLRGLSPSAPSPTAGLPGSRLLPPPRGLCGPRGPRDPGGIRNPTEHSTLGATAGLWA